MDAAVDSIVVCVVDAAMFCDVMIVVIGAMDTVVVGPLVRGMYSFTAPSPLVARWYLIHNSLYLNWQCLLTCQIHTIETEHHAAPTPAHLLRKFQLAIMLYLCIAGGAAPSHE